MPRPGAFDQAAGRSWQQLTAADRALLQLRMERAKRRFMETKKQSVITHYNQILVGNGIRGNAPLDASQH